MTENEMIDAHLDRLEAYLRGRGLDESTVECNLLAQCEYLTETCGSPQELAETIRVHDYDIAQGIFAVDTWSQIVDGKWVKK